MATQTRIVAFPKYAAAGLVNELDWLQSTEPMALDVMVMVETQLPDDYAEAEFDDDDEAVYTLTLPADFATVVETVLRRVEDEWTIDISAGVLGTEQGRQEAEPLAFTGGEVAK